MLAGGSDTNYGIPRHLLALEDIKFPKHKGALYLQHNEHKNLYQSVSEYFMDNKELYDFVDDGAYNRCVLMDEIWTMQWYPDTPVGFCAIAAPTFEDLMKYAEGINGANTRRNEVSDGIDG